MPDGDETKRHLRSVVASFASWSSSTYFGATKTATKREPAARADVLYID